MEKKYKNDWNMFIVFTNGDDYNPTLEIEGAEHYSFERCWASIKNEPEQALEWVEARITQLNKDNFEKDD